jgi:hypothetical protein
MATMDAKAWAVSALRIEASGDTPGTAGGTAGVVAGAAGVPEAEMTLSKLESMAAVLERSIERSIERLETSR